MSDEVPQEAEAEEIEIKSKKTREAAEQSRALNTLTDHVCSQKLVWAMSAKYHEKHPQLHSREHMDVFVGGRKGARHIES